ncbi:unnamed protein product [Cylindrotheca closterium]|uniref:YqgE/AlgH family protein n=1 Tax=Cylindrotheca closterium TaxID=2856 RepID=A0AAD2CIX6_9STRA|nr:unnamed protein product [Cylindrotheca closterium]
MCRIIRFILLLMAMRTDWSAGFQPLSNNPTRLSRFAKKTRQQTSSSTGGEGNTQDDWRAFRAKLVQGENSKDLPSSPSSSSSSPKSWTYDAGMLIERGSLVVSRVEDSLGCHDLRQPYFAKCVVLLVEHEENEFTQGIVLNRPSNLNLKDQDIVYYGDDGEQVFEDDDGDDDDEHNGSGTDTSWRMFFGGDIAGLHDEFENPLIVCLHNDTSTVAKSVSDEVLPGVYLTSHLGARALLDEGSLTPDACFTFYGFCGWDPGQLEREVKRGSWSIVSVDSDTLWSDLTTLRQSDNDPREVGLDMWKRIVGALDKQSNDQEEDDDSPEQEGQAVSDFQDLMLKEWATKMLMVPEPDMDETYVEDTDIYQAIRASGQTSQIQTGSLLRGSSQEESPFLLQDQFFHKSILLLLQESDDVSVGVTLHLPSSDGIEIDLSDGTKVVFPIRFGGPDGRGDEDPLLWFYFGTHKVGQILGGNGCLQTCSYEQVVDSLANGVATTHNFLVVQGFCTWQKGEEGSGGIKGEVIDGKFENISSHTAVKVLSHLGQQKLITDDSLRDNFSSILGAWEEGGSNQLEGDVVKGRCVFGSDMTVANLSDEALLTWIKIFLLGNAEYYR